MATTREIIFLRHGNTGAAENDLERQLTEKGLQQTGARRKALGNPTFDLVLASTASRAIDTAAVVAGIPKNEVIGLPELYLPSDPADKKALDDMFERLRYAPLRDYRAADVTGSLFRYGKRGAEEVLTAIEVAGTEAKKVLVGGHAVLLNSIVAHMIGGDSDFLLEANLGEVEGLRVVFDEEGGTSVELVR